jgi:DNA invertase Pin-like site-specific DNA recombinase
MIFIMKNAIRYFLYIRKSMDDDARQVLSLPAQVSELIRLAKREGLHIIETVEESMSAKKPGRPKFNRMIERIKSGAL